MDLRHIDLAILLVSAASVVALVVGSLLINVLLKARRQYQQSQREAEFRATWLAEQFRKKQQADDDGYSED